MPAKIFASMELKNAHVITDYQPYLSASNLCSPRREYLSNCTSLYCSWSEAASRGPQCFGSKPWELVDPIWKRFHTQPLGSDMCKMGAVPPENVVVAAAPFLCQFQDYCLDLGFC
mmetsp:Transcript_307/g.611  ORF Transcript_307/g.611 Transcript_307/m.611 type:complete len:115 (-) Transcript_307:76-420(-)